MKLWIHTMGERDEGYGIVAIHEDELASESDADFHMADGRGEWRFVGKFPRSHGQAWTWERDCDVYEILEWEL